MVFKKQYFKEFLKKIFPVMLKCILHPGVMSWNLLCSVKYFFDLMTDELRDMYCKYPQIRYTEFLNFKIGGYVFDLPDLPSFLFQYKEIMQDEIYLFKTFDDNPVIIDIGSNVGTSVIFFGKKYPNAQIYAYEPDPVIFQYLKKNVTRNCLANVHCYNAAVYDCEKDLFFNAEGADGGSVTGTESTKSIVVRSKDIKEILKIFPKINMLKIDIEGAENVVIPAAGKDLARIENIFIEFHQRHDEENHLPEILSVLNDAGFSYSIFNTQDNPSRAFVSRHNHPDFSMQLEIFAFKSKI